MRQVFRNSICIIFRLLRWISVILFNNNFIDEKFNVNNRQHELFCYTVTKILKTVFQRRSLVEDDMESSILIIVKILKPLRRGRCDE